MGNFIRSTTLINQSAIKQTVNRLQVRGGVQKQAEIISTVNEELLEYLKQFKRKHITIEQIQDFYKEVFPLLELKIDGKKLEWGTNATMYQPYSAGEYKGPFKMQLWSRSIIDIFAHLFRREDDKFYVNSRFVEDFVHENTHIMQCYMKPTKKVQQSEIKTAIEGLPMPKDFYTPEFWSIILDAKRHVAFSNNVYCEEYLFYNPKRFIKSLKKDLMRDNPPEGAFKANFKFCIREAEMENQAQQEGVLSRLKFKHPKLSEKPFYDNLFRKIANASAGTYRFKSKINAMKKEFFKMIEEERSKISINEAN